MGNDPREAKLPKWAQEELRILRMRLDEARKREENAQEGYPGTGIFLVKHPNRVPLPKHAHIQFSLKKGAIAVSIDPHGRGLYLVTHGTLSEHLSVQPSSSNACFVKTSED